MAEATMIDRLRTALAGAPIREQKMFGGTCFMLRGNMPVGTSKRGLLARVGRDAHAAAIARPHVVPMVMGGRTMEGYVFVEPAGTTTERDLNRWLALARAHVETLPPKAARTGKRPTSSRRLGAGPRD